MAQGCIVWRCWRCRTNRAAARCKHPRAGYSIVYKVGNRQRWETVGSNRHVAERRLAEVMAAIHSGSFREPTLIPFQVFSERWLAQRAEGAVKPSTLRFYRWVLDKHLTPAFGSSDLRELTPESIQAFLAKESKAGLAPQTVKHSLVVLKIMLKWARRCGYLAINPAQDVEAPRVPLREMDPLRPDEIQRLLAHSDEPYRTLFLTAILTGMRRGEILALQWGDIDWIQNLIFVRRALFWKTSKEAGANQARWLFQSPKSTTSKRVVPISPALRKALEDHRLATLDRRNPHDLVFAQADGQPLVPEVMIRQEFSPALTRAELRHVRFHDLRHTAASLLIAQGEHPKTIQAILGHASSKTTFDVYGHLFPSSLHAVGPKLDAQVFGPVDPANALLMNNPSSAATTGHHRPNRVTLSPTGSQG